MLAPTGAFPVSGAVDDSYFYWSEEMTPSVGLFKIPKSGGTPILVTTDGVIEALAVDSTAIYYSTDNGDIKRIPK